MAKFPHYRALWALVLAQIACSTPNPGRSPAGDLSLIGREGPLAVSSETAGNRFRSFANGNLPARKESKTCKAVPENIRGLFYEHFLYYVDRHGKRVGTEAAAAFANALARAWEESRGNSANVVDERSNGNVISASRFATDNLGREKGDSQLKATLESRAIVLRSPRIHMDRKTRFGLLKASAAQLSDSKSRGALLEVQALAARNPDAAASRCGSQWMFSDSERDLNEAFLEISRCKPGSRTQAEISCFAQWVTLCPNLNLTLALLKRPAAGSKKASKSACGEGFRSLLR